MSEQVNHIETANYTLITTPTAILTTRNEAYTGPTPVQEKMPDGGLCAFWGLSNDQPQRVNDDIFNYPLMSGVLDKKVDLLLSGGCRYGYIEVDPNTGAEKYIAKYDAQVESWMKGCRFEEQYLPEAATDWYTYANLFVELKKNKGGNKLWGVGCQDAGDVRLGVMDKRAETTKCYIADWKGGAAENDAFSLRTLDNYAGIAQQFIDMSDSRAILPLRYLVHGQRYYGKTPWAGLMANGTVDIAKRIPQLKNLLLQQLMNIRYHIEVDERFWAVLYGEAVWKKFTRDEKQVQMDDYALRLDKWLRKEGVGGAITTSMLPNVENKEQHSMVKINEKRFTLPEGAYIEDWQETDFITCRDMGLDPAIYGISPSKSGSSPGSGSQGRVLRTNHILNCRRDQAKILEPLELARDVNGWDPKYRFWFASYHAATLDRTNQVDAKANAGEER
ncbi:MAG TPA: hypothetical protein PLB89_04715 [Flavobacteriales bacterium]|nr:hypothetical protein [Flavobacteriales bacterium]